MGSDCPNLKTIKDRIMKTIEEIFNAVHEVYEMHDGGAIYISDKDIEKVKELIKQGQALPIDNVSKSFTTGCEVEGCDLKVFSLTYCKHHFLTED